MDSNLNIELLSDIQTVINRSRRGSPILMQFESHRAGPHLLFKSDWQTGVTFTQEADIHRESIG